LLHLLTSSFGSRSMSVLPLRTSLLMCYFILLASRNIQLTGLKELLLTHRRCSLLLATDCTLEDFRTQLLCIFADRHLTGGPCSRLSRRNFLPQGLSIGEVARIGKETAGFCKDRPSFPIGFPFP